MIWKRFHNPTMTATSTLLRTQNNYQVIKWNSYFENLFLLGIFTVCYYSSQFKPCNKFKCCESVHEIKFDKVLSHDFRFVLK